MREQTQTGESQNRLSILPIILWIPWSIGHLSKIFFFLIYTSLLKLGSYVSHNAKCPLMGVCDAFQTEEEFPSILTPFYFFSKISSPAWTVTEVTMNYGTKTLVLRNLLEFQRLPFSVDLKLEENQTCLCFGELAIGEWDRGFCLLLSTCSISYAWCHIFACSCQCCQWKV